MPYCTVDQFPFKYPNNSSKHILSLSYALKFGESEEMSSY